MNFLLSHLFELVYIVLTLCCLIVGICKKSKVVSVDTIFEQLLVRLPTMIRTAEKTGLSGIEKKNIVLLNSISWLSDMTGLSNLQVKEQYGSRIDSSIEEILSTPEKKEVL